MVAESEQEHSRNVLCMVHVLPAALGVQWSKDSRALAEAVLLLLWVGLAVPHRVCVILHLPQEVLLLTLISVHLRAWVHPNVTTGRVGSTQAARKEKQNSDQYRTTVKSHTRTEAQLITSTELTTNNQGVKPLCRDTHELLVL